MSQSGAVSCLSHPPSQPHDEGYEGYEAFLTFLRGHFDAETAESPPLFTTDAEGLFDAFLAALPADRRKHYDCRACKRFVDRFGGLVKVRDTGEVVPVMWAFNYHGFFRRACQDLSRRVLAARITGYFLSEESPWGTPYNRDVPHQCTWYHMSVTPRPAYVEKPAQPAWSLTASQVVAEKAQDFAVLSASLSDFPLEVAQKAHTLLKTESLYRFEKCLGAAEWFLELHQQCRKYPTKRSNLVWAAVATAPVGFCRVRSSALGTLLEDVAAEVPLPEIQRKFAAKMDPLRYQRPQSEPSAGNVAQAEKIVAALKSAGALDRRFARLEEVEAVWQPKVRSWAATDTPRGVFAHLLPKREVTPLTTGQPPVLMTWVKFARTVLPTAETIEYQVPPTRSSYFAFVTAADPQAPPILQWDREDRRNPVSWYVYHEGSFPAQWGLKPGEFRRVSAVTMKPSSWGPDGSQYAHHGQGAFFILDGARDTSRALGSPGAGFFPETLRSEYHGVRKTMEAYAKSAVISGYEGSSACGFAYTSGSKDTSPVFRVTSNGVAVLYQIDRWD